MFHRLVVSFGSVGTTRALMVAMVAKSLRTVVKEYTWKKTANDNANVINIYIKIYYYLNELLLYVTKCLPHLCVRV